MASMTDSAKRAAAADLRPVRAVGAPCPGQAVSSQAFGDGACLVRACGAISLAETRAIEHAALRAAIAGRRTIVLDLTGVTDLGGGVLGGILRLRRGLGAIDGRLVLVVDGPPADVLIRISVIQILVDVVASVDDAAELLSERTEGRGP